MLYVKNIIEIDNVVKNSVGIVKSIKENGVEVFFIGKNKTLLVKKEELEEVVLSLTGDDHEFKVCNICHVIKPVKMFDYNQNNITRKVRRPSCKDCRKIIDGKALKKEDSDRMDADAPSIYYTCPICGKSGIPGVTVKYVKDHNHETGEGREWICDSCNTGLGRFKDNIETLQKAIDYLKKF